MNERTSRRHFLRWISATSGAGVLGLAGLGCGSTPPSPNGDHDSGFGDDATGPDATAPGVPDAAHMPDVTAESCDPTGSDVLGPFHQEGAPHRTVLAGAEEAGERLVIAGRVYGPGCAGALAGVLLDVWQADEHGEYHNGSEYRLRGQMITDEQGAYRFETIRPGHYPLGNSMRPAHIHFTITKPGYRPLTTQLYFSDDPFLATNDPCTGCNSGDPTLIIDLEEVDSVWEGTFDIVLRQA